MKDIIRFFIVPLFTSAIIPTIVIIILIVINKSLKKNSPIKTDITTRKRPSNYRYQRCPSLLTPHEINFFRELRPIANKHGLAVCPKVRLADIIEPSKGQNQRAAFSRIKAKHIDFLLCKASNMQPMLAVELNDSSHNAQNRKDRDNFVEEALNDAGVPILWAYSTVDLEGKITALLSHQTINR